MSLKQKRLLASICWGEVGNCGKRQRERGLGLQFAMRGKGKDGFIGGGSIGLAEIRVLFVGK